MSSKTGTLPGTLSTPAGGQEPRDIFDNGVLRVEHDNYYVSLCGRPLKLRRKEFLIISRLTRNFDRIVPSEEIWRFAWGDRAPFNSESLHVHIYRLRRLLKPAGVRVDTMVNVGYRLADTGAAQDSSE